MRRLVVPDAETFAAAGENEISRTREGRYYHRLHVVLLVLGGFSCYEAARPYGDSPRSVEYWVHRLAAKGLEGLWEAERPGRPPRLSPAEKDRLREDLQRSPRELGYDRSLWDGVLLAHHLDTRYGVSLGVRQCQRLFHELGFSLQRPRRQAHEADPLQQEEFKNRSGKTSTVNLALVALSRFFSCLLDCRGSGYLAVSCSRLVAVPMRPYKMAV